MKQKAGLIVSFPARLSGVAGMNHEAAFRNEKGADNSI